MKKLFLFTILLIALGFAQSGHDGYGSYIWWTDTTIVADDTVETGWINIEYYPYMSIMVRTTNVADSTKYTVDYFVTYDTTGTDTLLTPSATDGTSDNSIFAITDTNSTWRVKSVQPPISRFAKVRIITDETANGCGNRIKFTVKTFLWKRLEIR